MNYFEAAKKRIENAPEIYANGKNIYQIGIDPFIINKNYATYFNVEVPLSEEELSQLIELAKVKYEQSEKEQVKLTLKTFLDV